MTREVLVGEFLVVDAKHFHDQRFALVPETFAQVDVADDVLLALMTERVDGGVDRGETLLELFAVTIAQLKQPIDERTY